MRLVRYILRSKRAALSNLAAFVAAGAIYGMAGEYRLSGEIGWPTTIIATLLGFYVVRRLTRWAWDLSTTVIARNAIQYRDWISKRTRG